MPMRFKESRVATDGTHGALFAVIFLLIPILTIIRSIIRVGYLCSPCVSLFRPHRRREKLIIRDYFKIFGKT